MAPKFRYETEERTLRDGSEVRWTVKIVVLANGKEGSRTIEDVRHGGRRIGEPDLDRLLRENRLTR